jgi:hypothetical protein
VKVSWPRIENDVATALRCAIAVANLGGPKEDDAVRVLARQLDSAALGHVAGGNDKLGLLGYAALYRVLGVMFRDKEIAGRHKRLCERIAGLLRVWVRRREGEAGGSQLDGLAVEDVAKLALRVLEWVVGIAGEDEGKIAGEDEGKIVGGDEGKIAGGDEGRRDGNLA